MDNKNNKKISRIGIVLFFLILIGIVLGVTYAFWTWNSSVNKNVVFSTPDIEKYIIYDEGDSKFIGNFQPVNTFCESANNTLSFYKKSEAANVKFTATIKMDINSIGKNIASSDDVYWVVTSGDNTIDCSNGLDSEGILAYGTFNGVSDGQTLDLLSDIDVTLEQQIFTVWIWIDNNGENLSKLSGETVDTNVWTLITMDGDNESVVTFDLNGGVESVEYTDVGEYVYTVPYDGEYKLEVWGAQGGNGDTAGTFIGGYGGYSVGNVNLNSNDSLYVNVGGSGTECYVTSNNTYKVCDGGYNGGGKSTAGRTSGGSVRDNGSGGGATHIATVSGTLSTLSSFLNNILIVAGGGGGANVIDSTDIVGNGGTGGGYIGNIATFNESLNNVYATGGTQFSGGINGSSTSLAAGGNITAGFGLGADRIGTSSGATGSGGGGGFYGGGMGILAPGGGGSGYIGNNLLTNKVMYCYDCETSSEINTRTYSTTNVSDAAVSNYAKSGNGAAKITLLSYAKEVSYSKKYGELPVVKKDGLEFVGWSTVKDDFTTLVTEETIVNVNSDHVLYALFAPVYKINFDVNGGKIDGSILTMNYTDVGEHEFVAPYNGKYKLEVWGAQGADATTVYTGGYGGYSVGIVKLMKNDTLYVNVGGAGESYTYKTNLAQTANGGYNGGGFGHTSSSSWPLRNLFSGGGASHIAKKNGILSSLELYKDDVLIVAGGGGAGVSQYGGTTSTSNRIYANGGSGGGFEGGDLQLIENYWTCGAQDSTTFYSKGGTQDSCGSYLSCGTLNTGNRKGCEFGQGYMGLSYIISDTATWGGGGGWYGGANGAGGSGYIGNNLLTDKAMYCYNCETSSDVDTLTYTTTNVSDSAISNYAKSGDGAARISFLFDTKEVVYFKEYGELPVPSKYGASFVGWNTKSDGSGDFVSSDTRVMNDSEHTLYAIWDNWNFDVSYSVNGGVIDSSTTSTDGNTIYNWTANNDIISLNGNSNFYKPNDLSNINLYDYNDVNYMNISRNGYSVVENSEWICLEGCKVDNSIYSQNASYKYSDFCDVNSESCNIVLGVNWKQVYTISYDANEGSGMPDTQEKLHGETLILSSLKPTREGYVFLGWSTSSDATLASYSPNSEFLINDNVILYAVWKLASPVNSYSCANGSVGSEPYVVTYDGNCTVIDDGN